MRTVGGRAGSQSFALDAGAGGPLAEEVDEGAEAGERLLAGHLLLDDRRHQGLHHEAGHCGRAASAGGAGGSSTSTGCRGSKPHGSSSAPSSAGTRSSAHSAPSPHASRAPRRPRRGLDPRVAGPSGVRMPRQSRSGRRSMRYVGSPPRAVAGAGCRRRGTASRAPDPRRHARRRATLPHGSDTPTTLSGVENATRPRAGIEQDFRQQMSYGDYLRLDLLLSAQQPQSDPPQHDELLFIVQHQTSELWLKLMVHELRSARALLAADDLSPALKRLARVKHIQHVLTDQWSVLATLTPSEYAEIRPFLATSSGFQSAQYREVEFLLGNKNADMVKVFGHDPAAQAELQSCCTSRPCTTSSWPTSPAGATTYRRAARPRLVAALPATPELVDVFAPVYAAPAEHWGVYETCEELVDVEDNFQQWRFRHLQVVQRTIGHKVGTGGSSGVDFLRRALDLTFFPELYEVRTRIGVLSAVGGPRTDWARAARPDRGDLADRRGHPVPQGQGGRAGRHPRPRPTPTTSRWWSLPRRHAAPAAYGRGLARHRLAADPADEPTLTVAEVHAAFDHARRPRRDRVAGGPGGRGEGPARPGDRRRAGLAARRHHRQRPPGRARRAGPGRSAAAAGAPLKAVRRAAMLAGARCPSRARPSRARRRSPRSASRSAGRCCRCSPPARPTSPPRWPRPAARGGHRHQARRHPHPGPQATATTS